MRIQILSDLHLENEPLESPEDPSADVVVLAGDIARGTRGLDWALSSFSKPLIYVPGNHEFYEHARNDLLSCLRAKSRGTTVNILDRESITIDGVEFFGTTLWTDFEFYETPEMDMAYAQRNVLDFHIIEESQGVLFTPALAAAEFSSSVTWLNDALAKSKMKKKIVISHHAPTAKSVVSRFAGSPINPAFASRLESFIEKNTIDIWIHGHMHTALDYEIASTRIMCNPRGYQPYESGNGFELYKTIEI